MCRPKRNQGSRGRSHRIQDRAQLWAEVWAQRLNGRTVAETATLFRISQRTVHNYVNLVNSLIVEVAKAVHVRPPTFSPTSSTRLSRRSVFEWMEELTVSNGTPRSSSESSSNEETSLNGKLIATEP